MAQDSPGWTGLHVPGPRSAEADPDRQLVERLRAGDEAAFAELVRGWSAMMLRVARAYVSTDASAQEVVQETWLAVIRGVESFEGRSSLRTWVFRILSNLAKTRGVREGRTVPISSLDTDEAKSSVAPDRFRGADDRYPQHWTPLGAPSPWEPGPEDGVLAGEVRALLAHALQQLPERQRAVVSLRDVHGLAAEEVCAALEISPANQRVLLHRGRARLRAELEEFYRPREVTRGHR